MNGPINEYLDNLTNFSMVGRVLKSGMTSAANAVKGELSKTHIGGLVTTIKQNLPDKKIKEKPTKEDKKSKVASDAGVKDSIKVLEKTVSDLRRKVSNTKTRIDEKRAIHKEIFKSLLEIRLLKATSELQVASLKKQIARLK